MLAILTGNNESASILVAAGADVELRNVRQKNAQDLAELALPEAGGLGGCLGMGSSVWLLAYGWLFCFVLVCSSSSSKHGLGPALH